MCQGGHIRASVEASQHHSLNSEITEDLYSSNMQLTKQSIKLEKSTICHHDGNPLAEIVLECNCH